MKNEFEQLCESLITTLRQTTLLRYPRQIQLSEEFRNALTREINRHMQILDESQQPIRDLPEKFLKALKFELTELTEAKMKKKQIELRPRQKWDINPKTRVNPGKKAGYDRPSEKKEERKSLNT
jgi:hypothetical protein